MREARVLTIASLLIASVAALAGCAEPDEASAQPPMGAPGMDDNATMPHGMHDDMGKGWAHGMRMNADGSITIDDLTIGNLTVHNMTVANMTQEEADAGAVNATDEGAIDGGAEPDANATTTTTVDGGTV